VAVQYTRSRSYRILFLITSISPPYYLDSVGSELLFGLEQFPDRFSSCQISELANRYCTDNGANDKSRFYFQCAGINRVIFGKFRFFFFFTYEVII
jgi:hypothetical protein